VVTCYYGTDLTKDLAKLAARSISGTSCGASHPKFAIEARPCALSILVRGAQFVPHRRVPWSGRYWRGDRHDGALAGASTRKMQGAEMTGVYWNYRSGTNLRHTTRPILRSRSNESCRSRPATALGASGKARKSGAVGTACAVSARLNRNVPSVFCHEVVRIFWQGSPH
jgi:hypothetical protein